MNTRPHPLCLIGLGVLAAGCGREEPFPESETCHLGGYEMADGDVLGLAPRAGGELRYVFLSGETGAAALAEDGAWRAGPEAPAGSARIELGACGEGRVVFAGADGAPRAGTKLAYVVTETVFDGVDGKRAGRLVLPAGGVASAIVVSVHGSESWSGRVGERLQILLPAFGIGVFAYDKRGTGESDGKYTQDFDILAGDAARARAEARRLYGGDVPIGYWGGSQGGWVAPLAALKGGADFVIAAYGMAESPLAEDREEVMQSLRRAGHGEEVLAKAREVTEATARVMASDFKDGFEDLAATKKKYKGEAWVKDMDGEFSDEFMSTPNWLIKIIGPFLDVGTSWEYDPRPTLEAIDVPHLWILAGDDSEAPHEKTLEILRDIQQSRPNLDIVVFPGTEHGIYEYRMNAEGEPEPVRFAAGYYPLIRDFILTGEARPSVDGPVFYEGDAGAE